jgi:hypothetical protein
MKRLIMLLAVSLVLISFVFAVEPTKKLDTKYLSVQIPEVPVSTTELKPTENEGKFNAKRFDIKAPNITMKVVHSILPTYLTDEVGPDDFLAITSLAVLQRLQGDETTLAIEKGEISTECGKPIKLLKMVFKGSMNGQTNFIKIQIYVMGRQHWMISAMSPSFDILRAHEYYFNSFVPKPDCKYAVVKGEAKA